MKTSNFESSTYNNMLRYIQKSPLSKVFYLEDFAQCGSYTSIRSEIVRMEQNSILVRLARGLYMNSIGYNSMNMNYLIEIILEDFSKRYNVSIHPTGEYLLYKLGYVYELPQQIELGYNHSCLRVINISDKYKIFFKPSSLTWVTNIVNLHLRYLLILLQTRWKTSYKVEKEYTLKNQASKINIKDFSLVCDIIPKRIRKKCIALNSFNQE